MAADPFEALGIAQQPAAAGISARPNGIDPMQALGIDPNTPAVAAPPEPSVSGGGIRRQLGAGGRDTMQGMLQYTPVGVLSDVGLQVYQWLTGKSAPSLMSSPQPPEPQTTGEKYARAVGQGIPAIGSFAAGAAAGAPTLGRALAEGGKSLATTALPVTAGQVTGEAAAEATPEPWQDIARAGGAVLGGGATAVGQAGAGMLAGAARRTGSAWGIGPKETFQGPGGEPVRATGQQAAAAREQLAQAAESSGPGGAEQFQSMLENNPHEIVPGAPSTTAQVAPLPGIAKLEDTVKTEAGAPFMARAEQQNAARVGAIQKLQDANNPTAVGQFFRDQLAALDAEGQQQVAGGREAVQGSTEALGGRVAPAAIGQEMRGAIQEELAPVQARRRELWQAIDPDGTLALDVTPLREAAKRIKAGISPSDTLTGQERAVIGHAAGINTPVIPFSDLQTLRSNILDAQRRSAAGEPLTTRGMARLNDLKSAVDESLAAAAEQKAAQEAQAVASGAMSPEQTMMTRLQELSERGRAAEQAAGLGAGDGGGEVSGPLSRGPAPAGTGMAGAAGQGAGGSGGPAGTAGLQGQAQPLTPNFDQAAADRYAAARDATLREKERFGRGPVGEVLARGAQGAPHRVLEADVPARFFTGRPSEPAQVQAFLNATGEGKGAALARDYLVSDLRRNGIIGQDGLVNADAFAKWQHRRGETIKLFPGLGDEFANVEAAQRALDDVQAAHATALKDYQNGVAKHFLNEEPATAVGKILRSQDRAKLMEQAIGRVQGNADALASLKGHVVDYILDRLTNAPKATAENAATPGMEEVGTLRPDAFNNWIGDNRQWLKRLFGGQGMQTLEMVGSDLRRQQLRTMATVGSQTAERAVSAAEHGSFRQHFPTALALIGEKIAETGAAAAGFHGVSGLLMEALGAAGPVVAHMLRQRGIQTVNDLVREAMLHPSVARELMARPRQETIGAIAARRIARAMAAVGAVEASGEKQQ